MLFNSLQFAIFFPVAALVYFIIPKKTRCLWLLLASYVFYMSASPKYVVFLLFSTLVTFAGALLVERAEPKKKKLKRWQEEPKPRKGYYIARIHEGINPVTGYKYRHYTMIRINRRI